MPTVDKILGDHPFFTGMKPAHLATLADVATVETFEEGRALFHEGGVADKCYLLLEGDVALEVHAPARGPFVVQTLHAGDIVGWSWLFPPYRWTFDVTVLSPVRAVVFDGVRLRAATETDRDLGYELLWRFAEVIVGRLEATRLQLMDVYGTPS